jgi:hypothetical protein
MKNTPKEVLIVLVGIGCFHGAAAYAADAVVPDLKKVSQGIGANIADKTIVRWETNVQGRDALFARGNIWLKDVNFTNGTIECDILGKSQPRGSNFPGIAFHGADDMTFDCVYFRPFNFRAENPENASHAVQYISHPQWPWQKLRAEKTGQYEKPITPPPDGDAWFHAKIVVAGRKVSVFVNDAAKPSLEVDLLNDRSGGRIGIWGGDAGDGGHFANLKITSASK